MTEPTDFDQDEAQLPGVDLPGMDEPTQRLLQGLNEEAARRTIRALQTGGLLFESHAVMCQALLTAARQLDRAAASARAKDYGVANLLAQLRETYLVLVSDVDKEGGDRDPFDQFLDELAGARGSSPAVRDAPES